MSIKQFFSSIVTVPNVTRDVIEGLCESGVSMVLFDFNGLSFEQSRKMIYEIRQGVFDFSLRTDKVPYSLSLVLRLKGTSITTGTIFQSQVRVVL